MAEPPTDNEAALQGFETLLRAANYKTGNDDVSATRDVGANERDPDHFMSSEDEAKFLRASAKQIQGHQAALAITIAKTCAKGSALAEVGALRQALDPFYEDDDIVIFGKDGSMTTEKLPPVQEPAAEAMPPQDKNEEDTGGSNNVSSRPAGGNTAKDVQLETVGDEEDNIATSAPVRIAYVQLENVGDEDSGPVSITGDTAAASHGEDGEKPKEDGDMKEGEKNKDSQGDSNDGKGDGAGSMKNHGGSNDDGKKDDNSGDEDNKKKKDSEEGEDNKNNHDDSKEANISEVEKRLLRSSANYTLTESKFVAYVIYDDENRDKPHQRIFGLKRDSKFGQMLFSAFPKSIKHPEHEFRYYHQGFPLGDNDTIGFLLDTHQMVLDDEDEFVIFAFPMNEEEEPCPASKPTAEEEEPKKSPASKSTATNTTATSQQKVAGTSQGTSPTTATTTSASKQNVAGTDRGESPAQKVEGKKPEKKKGGAKKKGNEKKQKTQAAATKEGAQEEAEVSKQQQKQKKDEAKKKRKDKVEKQKAAADKKAQAEVSKQQQKQKKDEAKKKRKDEVEKQKAAADKKTQAERSERLSQRSQRAESRANKNPSEEAPDESEEEMEESRAGARRSTVHPSTNARASTKSHSVKRRKTLHSGGGGDDNGDDKSTNARASTKSHSGKRRKTSHSGGGGGDDNGDDNERWMMDDSSASAPEDRKKKGKNGGRKDTRRNRGNRKRTANTSPVTPSQQMDAEVRRKIDGAAHAMEGAQQMSRPRYMNDDYNDSSDTESVVNERKWPKVQFGMFCYTEQKANPSGGRGGAFLKTPQLHFFTGSKAGNLRMKSVLTDIMEGNGEGIQVKCEKTYTKFKTAIFGHESIDQPQTNKNDDRKKARQEKEGI